MGIGLARGYTFKKNAWGSYSMWEVFWVQPTDTRDLGTQAPGMWGYRVERKPRAKKPAVPKKLKQLRGQLESIYTVWCETPNPLAPFDVGELDFVREVSAEERCELLRSSGSSSSKDSPPPAAAAAAAATPLCRPRLHFHRHLHLRSPPPPRKILRRMMSATAAAAGTPCVILVFPLASPTPSKEDAQPMMSWKF